MVMVVNKAYDVLDIMLFARYSSCERSLAAKGYLQEVSGCEVIAKATGE